MLKVLNLYAGIGGNRKLWEDVEVTAVEYEPKIAAIYQDFFPNDKVVIGDAHQYLLENFSKFDFIWASPPCPTHSRMNQLSNVQENKSVKYPEGHLISSYSISSSHLGHFISSSNHIAYSSDKL